MSHDDHENGGNSAGGSHSSGEVNLSETLRMWIEVSFDITYLIVIWGLVFSMRRQRYLNPADSAGVELSDEAIEQMLTIYLDGVTMPDSSVARCN